MMWAAACDPRLKVAVVSGWMCTTEGVFSVPNCACWELPGFVELMDVCEVHLLIAPRTVLFESAEHDACFPIRHTRQGYARIRAGYRVFEAPDAALQDVWPAGHEWHGVLAYPLVDKVRMATEIAREAAPDLLIDGELNGAVMGHMRIGPHDVEDIELQIPPRECASRRREILSVVAKHYCPPRSQIRHYCGGG